MAVLALPLPAADGRVAVFVEIDGASFLAANQANVAPVEIYAYALTPDGTVAGYMAEAFTLDVARHGEAVWNGGLRFAGWLGLTPGTYELRIMVTNARSLARGLQFVRLEIPVADQQPAVLPPLFAGPQRRDPWLGVRGRAGWRPAGEPAYPLTVGSRPMLPAARPVLVVGRAVTAQLFAGGLLQAPIRGSVELLGEEPAADAPYNPNAGRPIVATASFDIAEGERGADDVASVAVHFVPPAASPGRYSLSVKLETAAGTIVTPTIDVLLVDAGPKDRELLWSDLKGLDRGIAPPPIAAAESGERPTAGGLQSVRVVRAVRRLAARYRQALASSVRGGERRPAALLDFELGALGDHAEEPLTRLRQAEIQVAADLGRRRADLLLPMIGMHEDLLDLYRQRQLYSLVGHTRRLIELLAELYVELGGAPETAADALASLAGRMQEMRAISNSRRLFGRALEHAPHNPPALLGLAESYEKYGEYAQAVAQLEQLVSARPDLTEARLRLAVNLERIGDRQRYRALLSTIAVGDGTDWVRAIACEELARSLLEAGALEEAESVLQTALERMPERQALWILLAHVHDRQELPKRSWQSLESVYAAPEAVPRSERLVYDKWPNGPLELARLALRQAAEDLRSSLGQTLEPNSAGRR